jgi:hypothetical protein
MLVMIVSVCILKPPATKYARVDDVDRVITAHQPEAPF